MTKFLFDANAYDVVAADPQLKADITTLQIRGQIEAIYTHIERGELALIPDTRQIGQAEAVQGRAVSTGVTVLDRSFLGHCRLGSPETSALYSKLRGANPKHIEDAMIGATAFAEHAILVTNDKRLSGRMAEHAPTVEVLDARGLRAMVRRMISA